MDGDDAPSPFSKSERKRNRIGMVLAPIERQRHLGGSQIHDLTIATIVIDNRDEVPIAGGMQSPPQDMARPGFVIRLRRDINGSKMNPITSVGIPSNDGSNLFRKLAILQRAVEDFRTNENAGLAATSHWIHDLVEQILMTVFADQLYVDWPAILPIIRAGNADDLHFETVADQPVDRFDPRGSAVPNMNTKRFAERRLFMSACNHFLTLLTVVVICRQPSSLNFPRSFLGRARHINYHCRPDSRRDTIFLHWRSRRFYTARRSQERSSVFFSLCHACLPQAHVEYLREGS